MTRRASDRRLKLRGSNGVPTLVVNQMSLQTTPPQRGNWRTRSNDPVAFLPPCRGSRPWQPGPQFSPSGMSGAIPQDRTKHEPGAAYGLILLTDLLTANLDNPGYSWTKAPYATLASRPARRLRTDLDGRNLATDQKVGVRIVPPIRR